MLIALPCLPCPSLRRPLLSTNLIHLTTCLPVCLHPPPHSTGQLRPLPFSLLSHLPPPPCLSSSLTSASGRAVERCSPVDVDRHKSHGSKHTNQDAQRFTIYPSNTIRSSPSAPASVPGNPSTRLYNNHGLLLFATGLSPALPRQLRRNGRAISGIWRQWLHGSPQEKAQFSPRLCQSHLVGIRGCHGGRLRQSAWLHYCQNGPVRRRKPKVPGKPQHTTLYTLPEWVFLMTCNSAVWTTI